MLMDFLCLHNARGFLPKKMKELLSPRLSFWKGSIAHMIELIISLQSLIPANYSSISGCSFMMNESVTGFFSIHGATQKLSSFKYVLVNCFGNTFLYLFHLFWIFLSLVSLVYSCRFLQGK